MIGPLGTPEGPKREAKPVASASKYAIVGGSLGGIWDAKGAVRLHTGDYEQAAKLLAYLHYGLKNTVGEKARIAGIQVTVLIESDHAAREITGDICKASLVKIGVPPMPEAKQLRFNGRG